MIHGIDETHVYTEEQLKLTIDDLNLSVRAYESLKRDGIENVSDILKNLHRLDEVRNLGNKCRELIYKRLEELRRQNMTIDKAIEICKEDIEIYKRVAKYNSETFKKLHIGYEAIEVLIKCADEYRHLKNRNIYAYERGLHEGLVKGAEEGNKIALKAMIENSQPRYICAVCGAKIKHAEGEKV